jgi:acyl-CoA synthetase (AMP-forming)/AMP-acid ligase II
MATMTLEPSSITPARPALHDPASSLRWTHGELREAVSALAQRIGGARGDLAFLLCRSTAGAVTGYLACLEVACPVVLLDARTPPGPLRDLLARYRPVLCLTVDGTCPGPDYRAEEAGGAVRLWWREHGEPAAPSHPDLAVLLSTSGSTGSPKLVRLTRRNLEANADAIVASLRIGADERAMASLPLHYSYGLSVLNSHLRAGASVVLTEESVVSPRFWKLLRAEQCTSMPGVPYNYELLARLGFETLDAPSLRTLTQAGGRLGVDLVRRFQSEMARRGGRFFVMYGQTEATARIACLPWERLPEKLGSAGVAIPGGRLSVETAAGGEAEPRLPGEIVYRGPNVMMGYAEFREDLARGDDLQGVLRTGDLGYLDEEGFLFITGRSKRIGKVLGMRVNLDEVEARLRSRGPTAVVATDEGLLICCEYGDATLFSELAAELARDMRAGAASFRFRRVEALPLTANGKIDYPRLAPA